MSPGRPRDPGTGRFISDTRDNSIAIRELNTQLGEAVNRFEAMGRAIPTQQMPQFNEGLLVGTAALVGMNAALQDFTRSQIESAVQLERQQVSLQTISGSVEAATAQYQRLLEVARLPGINISQALQGSAQLQAIGLSGERAAEAIGAIGNALATSGQSAQEMRPIISGFRQLNAEGKILQEDLAIITTRIPSVIPLMREAFGGTRAEDVRKFYESIGEADRQTELFSERLIEMLQTLPTISDTAGNALENLEDTAERLQARIGTHLLPAVKEAATSLEDVLKAIENSDGATRSIAVFGSFATTMLSIVTAGASVRGALLLLRPLLPALLGGPWGIAIAAVGALAGGFVAWRAATSQAREEVKNLNTFIAQNTELLRANEAAIESGSLAELRASATAIRAARDAADARVTQLRESAEAQFNELRGIKRSGEAFEELSGSLRRTSADLEKAEAELERLNTTLKTTNEEADALEKFETNVNNLKTAIEELNEAAEASDGIGRILRGDGADIRGPQSNLIKVADAIIDDLDTYNQIAEAARGGDETAIENLRTLQDALRTASVDYLQVLRQAFDEAETIADFQEIERLAAQFQAAFGNVDFLPDVTSAFDGLEAASQAASQALAIELSAAQGLADEYERLAEIAQRRREAAEKTIQEVAKNTEEETRERAKLADNEAKFLQERTRVGTVEFRKQLGAAAQFGQERLRQEQSDHAESLNQAIEAGERVTERQLDDLDEQQRNRDRAARERTRADNRDARARERAALREARQLERFTRGLVRDVGSDFASGLADAFESDLIGDAVLESLRSHEGEMVDFLTDTFGAGAIGGFSAAVPFLRQILSGLFESLNTPDNLDLGAPGITEAQLFTGQFGNLRGERYFNEFGSQFDLSGLAAGLPSLDQPLDVNILGVPDALQREPLTANELIGIYDRYGIPHNLERAAENTRDSDVNLRSVLALLQTDAETVERLIRAAEDTPLQDYIDNRQALIRLFSAEQTAEFVAAGNELAEAIKRQTEEQVLAREAPDELTFLDNLELLLRQAGPIDPADTRLLDIEGLFDEQGVFQGLESFITRIREALVADIQGQPLPEAERADLISDFNVLADALNILPETADIFSTQLTAALDGSLADLEVGVDPEARVGVEIEPEDKVQVDDIPEGTKVPIEALPEGTKVPIEALPEGTKVPIEALPEGTKVPIEALPEGTEIPIEALPEGTEIPIEALPEGTEIPIEALPEGTEIPIEALPEGISIPFDGIGEASVPFEGVGEATVPVSVPQEVIDVFRVPEPPPQEVPPQAVTRPLPGDSATHTPVRTSIRGGEDEFPPLLTNIYSPAEADILRMIGEADALLPTGGAEPSLFRLESPVDLSADAKSTIMQAGEQTKVSPLGDALTVVPQGNAMKVTGEVETKGVTQVEGAVKADVNGVVSIDNVVPVQIVGLGTLIDDITDEVTQRIALGLGGFPAG